MILDTCCGNDRPLVAISRSPRSTSSPRGGLGIRIVRPRPPNQRLALLSRNPLGMAIHEREVLPTTVPGWRRKQFRATHTIPSRNGIERGDQDIRVGDESHILANQLCVQSKTWQETIRRCRAEQYVFGLLVFVQRLIPISWKRKRSVVVLTVHHHGQLKLLDIRHAGRLPYNIANMFGISWSRLNDGKKD
jgi:hypothetical protein